MTLTFTELLYAIDKIGSKLEDGDITHGESKQLYQFTQAALQSKEISFWQPIPLPPDTIMLIWNGRTMTPPMAFKTEHEANFFTGLHKPIAWLGIPKPPELPERLRKIQEQSGTDKPQEN